MVLGHGSAQAAYPKRLAIVRQGFKHLPIQIKFGFASDLKSGLAEPCLGAAAPFQVAGESLCPTFDVRKNCIAANRPARLIQFKYDGTTLHIGVMTATEAPRCRYPRDEPLYTLAH